MTPQAEFGPDVFDDADGPIHLTPDERNVLQGIANRVMREALDRVALVTPTEDDHDPDRVVRDAERNSRIARGADLATNVERMWGGDWQVEATINGHTNLFYEDTLADALIALAEAVDNTQPKE